MFGIIRSNLKNLVVGCMLYILFMSNVWADTCDLADADFPSDECSFNDLGINKQMLKFGQVDGFVEFNPGSGLVRFIRYGSAQYDFASSVNLYEIESDGDCDIRDEDDLDNVLDNIDYSDNVDFAFIPSTTNPREITDIWVLNCNIVLDR